jgi:hypothetical protein
MKAIVYSIVLLGGMMLVMMSTTAMLGVEKAKLHRFTKRNRTERVGPLQGRLFLAGASIR